MRRTRPRAEGRRALPTTVVDEGQFPPLEPRFERLPPCTYDSVQRYTAAEYAPLLPTHSNHRLLPDDRRTGLVDGVAAAIDAAGGVYDYPYLTEVRRFRRR